MTKNGKPLNIFGKFENAELVENKIPKEGYIPAMNPEQLIQINNNCLDDLKQNKIEQINNVKIIHENIINTMIEENNKYENEMDKNDEI